MNQVPKTPEEKLAAAKEYLRERGKYLMESNWKPTDARHTNVSATFAASGWEPPSQKRTQNGKTSKPKA